MEQGRIKFSPLFREMRKEAKLFWLLSSHRRPCQDARFMAKMRMYLQGYKSGWLAQFDEFRKLVCGKDETPDGLQISHQWTSNTPDSVTTSNVASGTYFVMDCTSKEMKDPLNCPFCESEEKGFSSAWGMSPEAWEEMKAKHLEEHCEHCPTCGQPISATSWVSD